MRTTLLKFLCIAGIVLQIVSVLAATPGTFLCVQADGVRHIESAASIGACRVAAPNAADVSIASAQSCVDTPLAAVVLSHDTMRAFDPTADHLLGEVPAFIRSTSDRTDAEHRSPIAREDERARPDLARLAMASVILVI